MKYRLILCALALAGGISASAQSLSSLKDSTLQVRYIFSGTNRTADISLDELVCSEGWFGRSVNMTSLPVRGNGQIEMRSKSSGEVLYRMSFCTLFQEWQATREATQVRKSFENVFLLPMPSDSALVTVRLFDFHDNVSAELTHIVAPSDPLIRMNGEKPHKFRYIHKGGDPKQCIDIAILAEGYTKRSMPVFMRDARIAVEAMLAHEPFASMADRLNFIAVPLVSEDEGVSVPQAGEWKDTPLHSNFNTFYSERYLTTLHLKDLHELLAGIPYEHIIILANTDTYGGGGIYNSYTLTTAHHKMFRPVVVHEFGHSFGALADEYYYDDQYEEYYYPDTEPWEQNITTLKDFDAKWKDMVDAGEAELIEGAGYQTKGVWRSREDCRMKTNKCEDFCPVCQRAIARMIDFYTIEKSE